VLSRVEPKPGTPEERDPVRHLEVLSSPALLGRGSPSPGFDTAARDVERRLAAHGLTGPNPNDPQSPYFQSFDLRSFSGAAQAEVKEPVDFGVELFEDGFYLDERLGPDDLRLLTQRYEETVGGQVVPPGEPPLSLEELRELSTRAGRVQNVLGLLPGTGPHSDQVLVVMAHLDHLGQRGASLYPGADDNASGSATLLAALPRLVAAQQRGELDRSILFLWTAAEERGLVGAKYFVDHPLPGIGLEQITGVVNLDMVGRWDAQRFSALDGTATAASPWREVVEQANVSLEDPFDRVNRDLERYRARQDGHVFSRLGEDVLVLFEGLSNPLGGGTLNRDYHRTTDTFANLMAETGGEKLRRMTDLLEKILVRAAG
jgi:aminopeptidase YwaD